MTKCTFLSTFPTFLQCYAKRDWKPRVCVGNKLWIYWFLKNSSTKYLPIFDDSCEEICNSKAFVDIATAGRHRVLSTVYIKHNLFHQSKLGWDVELQNTHIVLFKSPRDVMQVTTLSTQLGLGSELVNWYRDATFVPFGLCWLICRRGQTKDYVIARTVDLFRQNFMSPIVEDF